MLLALLRLLKAYLGGERRIVEQFDMPPERPLAESRYTSFADAWRCVPNPDARWRDGSRPEVAIKLRWLFATGYFFRTTLGVMLLFSLMPLYLGVMFGCIAFIGCPLSLVNERYNPVVTWILGGLWVVISLSGLIYAGARMLGHESAYAARAVW